MAVVCLLLMGCGDREPRAVPAVPYNAGPLDDRASTMPEAPVAKRVPFSAESHGRRIEDPYHWLKDPSYPEVNDPDVLAYLEAENAYFEAYMAPLQPRIDELFEEMKARQPQEDESVPYTKNGYRYQWRFHEGAQYRTWYRAPEETPEAWRVLLDENALAEGLEYFRLGALAVSPNGRYLAYSSDTNGSERFRLQVLDLTTSEPVGTPIEATTDTPIWDAASSSFLYVTVTEEWRPNKVWHHWLDERGEDHLVYEETDTSFFVGLDLTQSETFVVISTGGHTHNEAYLLPRDDLGATPRRVVAREPQHEYFVDHREGEFLIRSNRRQANFDIYRVADDADDLSVWTPVVEGDERHYLTGHMALRDTLVIEERLDGLDQIRLRFRDGSERYVKFPEAAYDAGLGTNPHAHADEIRLGYSSMVTPGTVFDYSIPEDTLTVRKVREIPSGYDASQFTTARITATARDGARVPISLVWKKDTPIDGSAPLYLYGYGAYGLAMPPSFSATRLSLLDRGFIYAIAHIRGGDDLGYHWYTDGKLQARTNTFNDFVDCARHLVAEGYVREGRIAIAGGSAGGELMGAVVNQAPALWGPWQRTSRSWTCSIRCWTRTCPLLRWSGPNGGIHWKTRQPSISSRAIHPTTSSLRARTRPCW